MKCVFIIFSIFIILNIINALEVVPIVKESTIDNESTRRHMFKFYYGEGEFWVFDNAKKKPYCFYMAADDPFDFDGEPISGIFQFENALSMSYNRKCKDPQLEVEMESGTSIYADQIGPLTFNDEPVYEIFYHSYIPPTSNDEQEQEYIH